MHHFRPLALGCILQFSVQMTGVCTFCFRLPLSFFLPRRLVGLTFPVADPLLPPAALQYYSPLIFANLGFDSVQTLRYQSYNSIVSLRPARRLRLRTS